jgi:hypothetical protein
LLFFGTREQKCHDKNAAIAFLRSSANIEIAAMLNAASDNGFTFVSPIP